MCTQSPKLIDSFAILAVGSRIRGREREGEGGEKRFGKHYDYQSGAVPIRISLPLTTSPIPDLLLAKFKWLQYKRGESRKFVAAQFPVNSDPAGK